jgi:hypothetical protein
MRHASLSHALEPTVPMSTVDILKEILGTLFIFFFFACLAQYFRLIKKISSNESVFSPMFWFHAAKDNEFYALLVLVCVLAIVFFVRMAIG